MAVDDAPLSARPALGFPAARRPGPEERQASPVGVRAALVTRRAPGSEHFIIFAVAAAFLVPGRLVLPGPLKSLGAPSLLVVFVGAATWLGLRLSGFNAGELRRPNPARLLLNAFSLAALLAYVAATRRPLTPIESAGSVRVLVTTLALVGLGLLTADGLRSAAAIRTVVRGLVVIGGLSATIGILQYLLPSFDYYAFWRLPLLVQNGVILDGTRSNFSRVQGAAIHPIEFSVCLAALVPLALHVARRDESRRWRRAATGCTVLMLAAVPTSVARSAVLALAVGLLLLSVDWTTRERVNAASVALVGLVAYRGVAPGLLGTIKSLFVHLNDDPSVTGRTNDYTAISALFWHRPWTGMGIGTFQPADYFFLDNQYLGTAVEQGVVGLAVLILLFTGGLFLARGARLRSRTPWDRGLGQALTGSLAALAGAAALFDELSFRQATTLVMVLTGLAGAHWRLHQDQRRMLSRDLSERARNTPAADARPEAVPRRAAL